MFSRGGFPKQPFFNSLVISQLQNCSGGKKPLTHYTRLNGTAARMAARQTCPKARGRPRPQKQPLRSTPLHHIISQFQNCPGGKKPLTRSTNLEGTAAKMAARHSTITVARPHRPDASAMCPYPKNFVALVGTYGLMRPHF